MVSHAMGGVPFHSVTSMCLQVPGDASFALLPQEGFDDPQNERHVARVAVGLGRMRLFGFVLRLGEYLQTLSFLLAFFADFLTVAGACEPTGRAFSCRLQTALAFSPNPKATNYAAGNHSGIKTTIGSMAQPDICDFLMLVWSFCPCPCLGQHYEFL